MDRKATIAVALALVAAGAWVLGGPPFPGAGPRTGPSTPPPASGPFPPPAGDVASPPAATAPSGAVHGVVLRDGKPGVATVRAYRPWSSGRREGPAVPWSEERRVIGNRAQDLLAGFDPACRARTEADGEGRWRFEGLGPGTFVFEATAPDGASGREVEFLDSDGSPLRRGEREAPPLEIRIRADGCTLRGRALLPGGAPFRGCVFLESVLGNFPDEEGDFLPRGVLPVPTGEDGRFRLSGLPPTEVTLATAVPGRRYRVGPGVRLPCDEEVTFTVGEGAVALEGRVVAPPDERPVAGAAVEVEHIGDPGAFERTTTDAGGLFRFQGEPGRRISIEVDAGDLGTGSLHLTPLRFPRVDPLLVRLEAPGAAAPSAPDPVGLLQGRIVDRDSGNGIAGVRVTALQAREILDRSSVSAEDGAFEIRDVPAGRVVVLAAGAGRVSASLADPASWTPDSDSVVVPADGGARKDVAVVPTGSVLGRVVDAEERGVAGVPVTPWMDGSAPAGGRGYYDRFVRERRNRQGTVEPLTAADGTFRCGDLLPGVPYTFLANREAGVPAASGPIVIPPGAEVEVSIRVPAPRFVEVEVLETGTGAPVAGVEVEGRAEFSDRLRAGLETTWTTGPDGRIRAGPLPAAPVRWGVRGRSLAGESHVLGPSDTAPVLLVVDPPDPPADLVIEGIVLFEDGTPAVAAACSVETESEQFMTHCFAREARTDWRGRFRRTGLRPGICSVRARALRDGREQVANVVVAAGTRDVVVRLHDGARAAAGLEGRIEERVRVRVLQPDGTPVGSGRARFLFETPEGVEVAEVEALDDGRCGAAIPRGPPASRFWFEVWNLWSDQGDDVGLGHGIFGPWPAAPGERDVTLAPEKRIRGRLVSPSGGPAGRGIRLWAEPTYAEIPGGSVWRPPWRMSFADTDAEGGFDFGWLGNREYRIRVETGGEFAPLPPIVARPGETEVVVALRAAARAEVRVVDPDGNPVRGAEVQARFAGTAPEDGGTGEASDARGVAVLAGLDPGGDYVLQVDPPDAREDLLGATRPGWKPEDSTVLLPRGCLLEVLVRAPDGRPLQGVPVRVRLPGAEEPLWDGATDGEGRAVAAPLPRGEVRVTASIPGPGETAFREAGDSVDAGSGSVALVLDPGGTALLRVRGWSRDCGGLVTFAREGDLDVTTVGLSTGGAVLLCGLSEGALYDVYIRQWRSTARDRSLLVRGVRAGDAPRDVVPVESRSIGGTVVLRDGDREFDVAVLVGRAPLIPGYRYSTNGGGRFEVPVVPPGTWTVEVTCRGEDGSTRRATATVEAGGTVAIDARE
ncbi:MAG: carboxypeptidase regulatory-like domain-containing protein [Planctomycetaceae bacterium]|nr:carboxypeptidase-like regulatory domain-containing protein [Planctomycetota bacterium]NUN51671.1 carboxypeptidase regulatory-like domain-containing protein [Planctomycetaceae bacterium]